MYRKYRGHLAVVAVIFPTFFSVQPKITLFTSGSWTCVMAAAAAAALAAAAAAAAALAPLLRFLWGPGVPGVTAEAALGSTGPCFLFLCMANACLKQGTSREGHVMLDTGPLKLFDNVEHIVTS